MDRLGSPVFLACWLGYSPNVDHSTDGHRRNCSHRVSSSGERKNFKRQWDSLRERERERQKKEKVPLVWRVTRRDSAAAAAAIRETRSYARYSNRPNSKIEPVLIEEVRCVWWLTIQKRKTTDFFFFLQKRGLLTFQSVASARRGRAQIKQRVNSVTTTKLSNDGKGERRRLSKYPMTCR